MLLENEHRVDYFKGKRLTGPRGVAADLNTGRNKQLVDKYCHFGNGDPPVLVDNAGGHIVDSTGALNLQVVPKTMDVMGGGGGGDRAGDGERVVTALGQADGDQVSGLVLPGHGPGMNKEVPAGAEAEEAGVQVQSKDKGDAECSEGGCRDPYHESLQGAHLGVLLQRAQSPTRNVSNGEVIVIILESPVLFLTFRVHHLTLALALTASRESLPKNITTLKVVLSKLPVVK